MCPVLYSLLLFFDVSKGKCIAQGVRSWYRIDDGGDGSAGRRGLAIMINGLLIKLNQKRRPRTSPLTPKAWISCWCWLLMGTKALLHHQWPVGMKVTRAEVNGIEMVVKFVVIKINKIQINVHFNHFLEGLQNPFFRKLQIILYTLLDGNTVQVNSTIAQTIRHNLSWHQMLFHVA